MVECFLLSPLEDYSSCPACGSAMKELHAKAVCTQCNYKRGCCDLL